MFFISVPCSLGIMQMILSESSEKNGANLSSNKRATTVTTITKQFHLILLCPKNISLFKFFLILLTLLLLFVH